MSLRQREVSSPGERGQAAETIHALVTGRLQRLQISPQTSCCPEVQHWAGVTVDSWVATTAQCRGSRNIFGELGLGPSRWSWPGRRAPNAACWIYWRRLERWALADRGGARENHRTPQMIAAFRLAGCCSLGQAGSACRAGSPSIDPLGEADLSQLDSDADRLPAADLRRRCGRAAEQVGAALPGGAGGLAVITATAGAAIEATPSSRTKLTRREEQSSAIARARLTRSPQRRQVAAQEIGGADHDDRDARSAQRVVADGPRRWGAASRGHCSSRRSADHAARFSEGPASRS